MQTHFQKVINRMSRGILGVLLSTPVALLSAEGDNTPAAARLDHGQERFGQRLCASSPHHILQHDAWLATRLREAVGINKGEVKRAEYVSSSRGAMFQEIYVKSR